MAGIAGVIESATRATKADVPATVKRAKKYLSVSDELGYVAGQDTTQIVGLERGIDVKG